MGADPHSNFKGEKAVEHMMGDFMSKHLMGVMFASDEERPAKLEALVAEGGPWRNFLTSFSDKCLGDSKFLCGETVTVHDMAAAGFFHNIVLNENNVKVGPALRGVFEEHGSDRLKAYITDFGTDMAEYLSARAENHKCTF